MILKVVMKILNAMFSKGLGGIEQVFLDYTQALKLGRHDVLPVIHPSASVSNKIKDKFASVRNFGKFDLIAVHKLRKLIENESPQCIISHGNRATTLMRKATNAVPIISVCHNYKFKPLIGSDAIITITDHLKEEVVKFGQNRDRVFHVPNFIQLPENASYIEPKYNKPPVIGYLGRLVHKKGVDVLIKALAELKQKGVDFKCLIAGDGEEKAKLTKLVSKEKLDDKIEFIGWVENKQKFFKDIDILSVPSRHEPFGIVLLESFLNSKPMVVTKSEGPLEIIDDGKDGLFCEIDDVESLSMMLEKLIVDPKLAKKLSKAGFQKVQYYSAFETSRKLSRIIEKVIYKKLF